MKIVSELRLPAGVEGWLYSTVSEPEGEPTVTLVRLEGIREVETDDEFLTQYLVLAPEELPRWTHEVMPTRIGALIKACDDSVELARTQFRYLKQEAAEDDRPVKAEVEKYYNAVIEHAQKLKDRYLQLVTTGARPKIITLCGSTRFTAEMLDEAWRLTKEGNIVIHWNILNGHEALHHGAEREGDDVKRIIDELYLYKVAMADEVRVINLGGYVGESTKAEILHAAKLGKKITWLKPDMIHILPKDLKKALKIVDIDRLPQA